MHFVPWLMLLYTPLRLKPQKCDIGTWNDTLINRHELFTESPGLRGIYYVQHVFAAAASAFIVYQLIGPWEIWTKFLISNFQAN